MLGGSWLWRHNLVLRSALYYIFIGFNFFYFCIPSILIEIDNSLFSSQQPSTSKRIFWQLWCISRILFSIWPNRPRIKIAWSFAIVVRWILLHVSLFFSSFSRWWVIFILHFLFSYKPFQLGEDHEACRSQCSGTSRYSISPNHSYGLCGSWGRSFLFNRGRLIHLFLLCFSFQTLLFPVQDHCCRSENLEGAREMDKKAAEAWVGHPYYDVIDNSTDFDTKVRYSILKS